jgi:hypothetical protein
MPYRHVLPANTKALSKSDFGDFSLENISFETSIGDVLHAAMVFYQISIRSGASLKSQLVRQRGQRRERSAESGWFTELEVSGTKVSTA